MQQNTIMPKNPAEPRKLMLLAIFTALLLFPLAALPVAKASARKPDVPSLPQTRAQNTEPTKATKRDRRGKAADAETRMKSIAASFPDFDHTPNVVYKQVGDQTLQMAFPHWRLRPKRR